MTFSKPDKKHLPDRAQWELKSFMPGARFVRVYNHTKAVDPSTGVARYRPIDFNSTLVKDKRNVRGRFSARQHHNAIEHYSYLYLGEQALDERVALLECIDVLSLGRHRDDGFRLLDQAAVQDLSFAYIKLRKPITLLDISTEPFAGIYKADLATLGGDNYRATRRWGRYFRRVAPELAGLYYRPVKYGTDRTGGNVVLFAPHMQHGDMIDEDFTTVRLTDREGVARLLALGPEIRLSYIGGVA